MASPNELKLIEKMVRAKVYLESAKQQHTDSCATEDPHMAGRCTCGADRVNTPIQKALKELDLT